MFPRRSSRRQDEEKFTFKPQNPKDFGTSAMALSAPSFDPQPVWLSGASNTVLSNAFLDGALGTTPSTDLQYFTTQPTSFAGSIARDVAPFKRERDFRDRILKEISKPSGKSEKQKEYASFDLDLGRSAWKKGIKNQLSVIASQKQTSQDEVKKFIDKDFRFSLLDGLTQGIREGFGLPKPTKYNQEQCEKLYTRVLSMDPTLLTAAWDTMYQILECLSVFQLFEKKYKQTMRDITAFVKAELTKRGRAVGAAVGSAVTSFLANVGNRNLMGDHREAYDWFTAMAQRLIDACRIFDLPKPEFDLELRMDQADDDDETIMTSSSTQPPGPPPPPGSSGTGLRDVPGAQAQTSDSNVGMGGGASGGPGGGGGGGGGGGPGPGGGSPPGPETGSPTGSPPTVPDTPALDNGVVASSYSSLLLFAINYLLVPYSIANMMKGIYNAVAGPTIPRDIEQASEQALVRSRGRIASLPMLLSSLLPRQFWTSNLILMILESNPTGNWMQVSNIINNWYSYLVNTEVVNQVAGQPLLQGVDIDQAAIENAEFVLTDFATRGDQRGDLPAEIRRDLQIVIDALRSQRGGGSGGSVVAETSGSTVAESSAQGAERVARENRDETRVGVSSEVPQLIQQVRGLIANFPTGVGLLRRIDPAIELARAFARMTTANDNRFMANNVNLLWDFAVPVYRMVRFLINNMYAGDSARARANRGLYTLPDTLEYPITSDTVRTFSRVAESVNMIEAANTSPGIAGFRTFLLALIEMMDDYVNSLAEASAAATMVRP
jgi:hypothetical protein